MGKRKDASQYPSRRRKTNRRVIAKRKIKTENKNLFVHSTISDVTNDNATASSSPLQDLETIWESEKQIASDSSTTPVLESEMEPSTSKGLVDENYDFSFIPLDEYKKIMDEPIAVEKDTIITPNIFQGNRVVDISYMLGWATTLQSEHSKICTSGLLKPIAESRLGTGLISVITFKCDMCHREVKHHTEDPTKKSVINIGCVWGTLAAGSTFGQVQEVLTTMNIPPMPYNHFHKIENELGTIWKDSLWRNMEKAGAEELKIAKENRQVTSEGVAFITVYLDGGWSKRSYGHSYNAASGTAVIIGQATGKVLFVGVRNKYCSICTRAANKQISPGEHLCYRNWTRSSSAMEADIVVEGFCTSEIMHGLQYRQFIADGDSSVFAKIKEKVPYGRYVEKIECSNHAIKNYGKALYAIKSDTNINIAARKMLTTKNIASLQKIAQHSLYDNAHGHIYSLKIDLQNGPKHVFDDHLQCKDYYCENVGDC